FRQDLYYRLNVLPVRLKPLRDRREEIPMLVEHFLKKHKKRVSKGAMSRLCEYSWPGNVRELANIIERAVVLSPGDEISGETLSSWLDGGTRTPQVMVGVPLANVERKIIEENLKANGGNREKTARILGITSRTLRDKLKKWGVA
ncbi:MAG TPA: helix-turn-helix domain-containing protein, partial [Planctomycetota bacterium]|nr:helix-turn-helix domain-containing protein [Planctomycetota bacterium]